MDSWKTSKPSEARSAITTESFGLRRRASTGSRMIPAVMKPAPPMNTSIGIAFATTYRDENKATSASLLVLLSVWALAPDTEAAVSPCLDTTTISFLSSTYLQHRDLFGGTGGGPLNPPRESPPIARIKRFAGETVYLAGKSLSSSVRSSSLSLHPLAPASSRTWAGSEARGIGKTFALEVSQFRATWEGVFESFLANSSSLLSPEASLPWARG